MDIKNTKGFTLLELLIVVAIIAILATLVVLILNPVETLKKARDAQRVSDLAAIKFSLAFYNISKLKPHLDGDYDNNYCVDGSLDRIWVSYPTNSGGLSNPPTGFTWTQQSLANASFISAVEAVPAVPTAYGWIPVALGSLTGGSPLSNWPLDPINSIGLISAVTNNDLIYRYSCDSSDNTFEINAKLESLEFSQKALLDGGNNSNLYEIGAKLSILPSTNNF